MVITGFEPKEPRVFSVGPGDSSTYGMGASSATPNSATRQTTATVSAVDLWFMAEMMSPGRLRPGRGAPGQATDRDAVGRFLRGRDEGVAPAGGRTVESLLHPGHGGRGVVTLHVVPLTTGPRRPHHRQQR